MKGLIFFVLLCGCLPPVDDCTPNETRCWINEAQICGSDQRWRTFLDCGTLGEGEVWSCCQMPADEEDGIPAGCGCTAGGCGEVE